MLIGEYRHTIDDKKRVSLPAKFREELGRTVVITRGFDNCLSVYSLKEWQSVSEKLGKLPSNQTESRAYARVILSGATEADLDKLGRVLVPDYLKNYAGLGKTIVVCGLSNRLEIWDETKWETYRAKAEGEVEQLAEKLAGTAL